VWGDTCPPAVCGLMDGRGPFGLPGSVEQCVLHCFHGVYMEALLLLYVCQRVLF